MKNWDGLSMQRALLTCEIVSETRVTEVGPGEMLYLKLADKLIPLGTDEHFADMLRFALRRNAEAWEPPFSQRCDMCGEPKDGRDHSGCDAAYPETLR